LPTVGTQTQERVRPLSRAEAWVMTSLVIVVFMFGAGLQIAAMGRVSTIEDQLRQREQGTTRVNELIARVERLGRCQYEQVAEHRLASREHFVDVAEVLRRPFETQTPLTPHTGDLSVCNEFGPKAVMVPRPGG
jgi:hypothetical protein